MQSKVKQHPTAVSFPPFGGIDVRYTHRGDPVSADLENFRILPDGSLQKREGVRMHRSLPGLHCRAVFTGSLGERRRHYLLTDRNVSTPDLDGGNLTVVGHVDTSVGDAAFFYHRDSLYLCDGDSFYLVSDEGVERVQPYVPLVGRDWPSIKLGEWLEPRSLATPQVRISYVLEENFMPYLRTGGAVSAVDIVLRNGTPLPPDTYHIDAPSDCIVITSGELQTGDRLEICFRYAKENLSPHGDNLLRCTRADTIGGIHNGRVLLWNGSKRNMLFPSHSVSAEALADCRRLFPNCSPLYFPEHSEIVLGNGQYPVTGISRHYDRLLVFTRGCTYKLDVTQSEDATLELSEINPCFGCASPGAIVYCENDPVTVGEQDVLRWNDESDEYDTCNAHSISAPIAAHLGDRFFQNAIAFENRPQRELWFHERGSDTVWIYQIALGTWYRFTGICAECFFAYENTVAFCADGILWIFDPLLGSDRDPREDPIPTVARFVSGLLDYSTDAEKHADALSLRGDTDSCTLSLTLTPNVGRAVTVHIRPEELAHHKHARRRLGTGRFRYATLTLSTEGVGRPILRSLVSTVR